MSLHESLQASALAVGLIAMYTSIGVAIELAALSGECLPGPSTVPVCTSVHKFRPGLHTLTISCLSVLNSGIALLKDKCSKTVLCQRMLVPLTYTLQAAFWCR